MAGELKASDTEEEVIRAVLSGLAAAPVSIFGISVVKRAILRPPKHNEEIYRRAVTELIRQIVEQHPRVTLYLDKRYTKPALHVQLELAIRERIKEVSGQVVLIRLEDSQRFKALQAADFVAWALRLKHEGHDESLWKLIEGRVAWEEQLEISLW